MQFLMGLGDAYDHVRSQVLLMDPLPLIGKAYSMIFRVEKQREEQIGLQNEPAMTATFAGKQGTSGSGPRKQSFINKRLQFCDHCRRTGHTRESCFKLTGYPEWYKSLIDQRRSEKVTASRGLYANSETGEGSSQGVVPAVDSACSDLIRQEISRMMENSEFSQEQTTNLVDFEDFAEVQHLLRLPDGTRRKITHKGDVKIPDNIRLIGVLYIPSFKHNLISVNKACVDNSLRILFTHNQWFLQDPQAQKTLAIAKLKGRLYCFDKDSFNTTAK
ncbi:UNVERIFIED_CONTAM: hypothetical protein Slati_2489600 [Sesamum latifolium]|uniref:Retrovirus-related Pol polyprotein from transposon TNT 1-94-like beta-barrel domain-containing protein n=1 Tax=Sesamum latifolium TaxID=2727402 RepID=A0AAW2WJS8_9LAMI